MREPKIIFSAIMMSGVLFVGVIAGGVMQPKASAALPAAFVGQLAQSTATAVPSTPGPATTAVPKAERPDMPYGRGGHGRGGKGGRHGGLGGPGRHIEAATADGAARSISQTIGIITLVKADLAYATGKMDTATVQSWLNNADTLLNSARGANISGQYGRAALTANAAGELAWAADLLMAQALGAEVLPSNAQRSMRGRDGMRGGVTTPTGLTQAQASRELASLYNSIVMRGALQGTADSTNYLNIAKEYYRTAYNAYGAGNYADAYKAAAVARRLLGVSDSLLRANTAPNNVDTPVQVPAPTF
jgi:hypothetical protein